MNDYVQTIDDHLKALLQKNVKLNLNNNVYREGKLILFSHGYFCLNLHIRNYIKNKNELLKIPLPFDVEYHDDGLLFFDYRIMKFIHNNVVAKSVIDKIKKKTLSKFYDKILTIEVLQ